MNYGKALRLVRAARGESQKEVARLARLNASYISLVEAGHRTPSLEALQAIAKALDVPAYLIMLLASEQDELHGISKDQAEAIGREMLGLIAARGRDD